MDYRLKSFGGNQPHRQPVHLFRDLIVFLAKGNQFGKLAFAGPIFLAQRQHLPLDQRNRPPTMRVRHKNLRHQVSILLKKTRIVFQVIGDVVRKHALVPLWKRRTKRGYSMQKRIAETGIYLNFLKQFLENNSSIHQYGGASAPRGRL